MLHIAAFFVRLVDLAERKLFLMPVRPPTGQYFLHQNVGKTMVHSFFFVFNLKIVQIRLLIESDVREQVDRRKSFRNPNVLHELNFYLAHGSCVGLGPSQTCLTFCRYRSISGNA